MVSQEKVAVSALNSYRLGTGLIWIGVLIWMPFIILRATGSTPSLLWFLPFHLLGVIGGSKLRKAAGREMQLQSEPKTKLRSMGHMLIFVGILVWAPYFYLKYAAQQPVEVGQFLPYHLAGVLSGVFLLLINLFMKYRKE